MSRLIPTIPYVTLVLTGAFSNLELDYEAQARSLGAGPLRTFWHVTLPIVRPSLVVAAFFAFLISWSEYILTLEPLGKGMLATSCGSTTWCDEKDYSPTCRARASHGTWSSSPSTSSNPMR